jgi:hypothetical protein
MKPAKLGDTRWTVLLGRAMLWAGIAGVATAPARAQTVWELTPYRVQVVLATAPAPELTPHLQADLGSDLTRQAAALIGASWDLRVGILCYPPVAPRVKALLNETDDVAVLDVQATSDAQADEDSQAAEDSQAGKLRRLRHAMIRDIETIPADSLPNPWLDSDQLDKLILLVVLPGPAGYRVTARELDVRTWTWNTPATVAVWHPAKLCDAAFRAVQAGFAPLAQITSVDIKKKRVTLRVRAAGFSSRDQQSLALAPGDLFQPVIRYNGRDGKLRKDKEGNPLPPQPVPWTFLTIEQVTPRGLTCELHSGLRTPLTGRRQGWVEQLALGVRPPGKPTRLVLQSRTDPDERLAGYDVYDHAPDSDTSQLLGRTDRQGSVTIPPGEHPLRMLLVKSGSELLARLPLVPGREPEQVAAVRDDDPRLQAEGYITGLQDELIDLVCRRAVLLAQVENQIDQKKLDEAEKLVRQLQRLKNRSDFDLYLLQEQRKIPPSTDKLAQAKIDAMFTKTRKLVDQYLRSEVIEQMARQVQKAKAAESAQGS